MNKKRSKLNGLTMVSIPEFIVLEKKLCKHKKVDKTWKSKI